MSISDQQCQNRCQFYPNTAESSTGVPSALNYSWSPQGSGNTSGGVVQRQCSGGGSSSCSPVTTSFSPSLYYEDQGMGSMQLQRRYAQTGELCNRWDFSENKVHTNVQ